MKLEKLNNVIALCKKNDRAAQSELYGVFAGKMFAVCRMYSNSYEDAQDTFQEAFVHAFKKIDQYKSKGSFEGWLRRIMVNTCLEKFRKEQKIWMVTNQEVAEEPVEEFDEENEQYSSKELMNLITELPKRYQMVFTLYVLEDYSHQEIADELEISVGTSKSNLARARAWLKDRLKKKSKQNIKQQRLVNETSYR